MIKVLTAWKKVDIDDDVTVEVKGLNVKEFYRAQAIVKRLSQDVEGEMGEELVEALGQIVKRNARNLRGIELDDGVSPRDATVEDLTEYGGLFVHFIQIATALLQASQLTGADVGNSSAPPEPTTPPAESPPEAGE